MPFSPSKRGQEIQHLKSVFKGKPEYRAEDGRVLLIADISFREGEPFCQTSVDWANVTEIILEASLMFICSSGLSSNPHFQRTGKTPMHFHNEGRDISVLTLRKLLECVCVFVPKQTSSGHTLEWGFSGVHPLMLMLPSRPGLSLWLCACIHPLVPNDIQTLAWPFSMLVK